MHSFVWGAWIWWKHLLKLISEVPLFQVFTYKEVCLEYFYFTRKGFDSIRGMVRKGLHMETYTYKLATMATPQTIWWENTALLTSTTTKNSCFTITLPSAIAWLSLQTNWMVWTHLGPTLASYHCWWCTRALQWPGKLEQAKTEVELVFTHSWNRAW